MKKRPTSAPPTSHSAACTHRSTPTLPPAIFRDEDLWTSNARQLTLFAERLIRRYPWQGSFGGRPSGKDATDFVSEAQALLMEGRRRCRVDEDPVHCIYGVLRSIIWHDSQTPENRTGHLHLVPIRPNDDENGDVDETIVSDTNVADIEDGLPPTSSWRITSRTSPRIVISAISTFSLLTS